MVKDHCHLTSKFRGSAKNECNSNTRNKYASFLPNFFHNFSGYGCNLNFEKVNEMANKTTFGKKEKISEQKHKKTTYP